MERLRRQSPSLRRRQSADVWRRLRRLAAYRQAKLVCAYVALPYEVQTWQMIEEMLASGKRVVVPAVRAAARDLALYELRDPARELSAGAFGVLEPRADGRREVPPEEVDLVLVPGVAFDRAGNRLGHGAGYFDRLLARLPSDVPTIGLAYRCQLLERLPVDTHDRPVQRVLAA